MDGRVHPLQEPDSRLVASEVQGAQPVTVERLVVLAGRRYERLENGAIVQAVDDRAGRAGVVDPDIRQRRRKAIHHEIVDHLQTVGRAVWLKVADAVAIGVIGPGDLRRGRFEGGFDQPGRMRVQRPHQQPPLTKAHRMGIVVEALMANSQAGHRGPVAGALSDSNAPWTALFKAPAITEVTAATPGTNSQAGG